jgi:ligand-binding sensor domain-containing protein/two-component sensor histidine kinase
MSNKGRGVFRFGALLGLCLCSLLARAERLPVRVYTTADGLWSSAINYLVRDSHGFIWFCTRDGLSRFDGYRFVNYRVGNSAQSPNVSYLLETRKGIYWIALNGGGLFRYDPNAATVPVVSDDGRTQLNAELVSPKSFLTLYEDREGRLWGGTDELLLIEDEGGRVSFRPVALSLLAEMKPNRGILTICEGRDGSLWLGTNYGLLRLLPDGRLIRFVVHPRSGMDGVRVVLEDAAGRIWIGHADGLYVLEPEPLDALPTAERDAARPLGAQPRSAQAGQTLLPDTPGAAVDLTDVVLSSTEWVRRGNSFNAELVTGLYQAADGRIWIAAADSLIVFDGQHFASYAAAQGLTESALNCVAEDADCDLRSGSFSGVVRLNAQGLKSYDQSDGLSSSTLHAIYEDRAGALNVVTGNWLISRFDGRRFTTVRPDLPFDIKFSWASNVALLDHTGAWWLLTNEKLYRFAPVPRLDDLAHARPVAVYDGRDGLASNHPYCIFEDARGDLWISTRGGDGSPDGLTRWQRADETFHTFTVSDGLPPEASAASFAEDRAGHLWFGFYQGGLARYADGHFETFTTRDDLPDGLITALYSDHAGRLWIASNNGGVARVDDPTAAHPRFVHYTAKEGLSSNNARCLTEDLAGHIYVGTVRGVDRLNPETGNVTHYTVADGLAADFVRAAYRDRQGALWFGTFKGLSRLDPQPEQTPSAPSVLINGLQIAGVRQPLVGFGSAQLDRLELSAAQNNLQIDFASLSIAHAEQLRYQYRLEGADADWSAPTDQRTVTYANLAPGSYRFLVRALSADGVASARPASFEFRILRPVWQRWWFLASAALAFGGAAFVLYCYRVRQLLALEHVRTRIATDLHDDIGASLSRMAVLSEVVKRQDEIKSDASVRMLTEIADSARALVDAMGDIVWSIDPRRDDLQSVTTRIRQFASDVLEARGIKWDLLLPRELAQVKLNAEQRRQILLIFKEALTNVVRHAECANVSLSLALDGRALVAEVQDDGRGFQSAQAAQANGNGRGGNGLNNMRARVAQLGGEFHVASSPGAGTRLTFKVPLK